MLYFDFSLIKMLYWVCEDTGLRPSFPQLEIAIRRNFDGFSKIDTWGCFMKHLPRHNPAEDSKEVGIPFGKYYKCPFLINFTVCARCFIKMTLLQLCWCNYIPTIPYYSDLLTFIANANFRTSTGTRKFESQ